MKVEVGANISTQSTLLSYEVLIKHIGTELMVVDPCPKNCQQNNIEITWSICH